MLRRIALLPIVVLLIAGVYAIALAQEEEHSVYIPSVSGGLAPAATPLPGDTATPTATLTVAASPTPTATETPTATATETSTSVPTNTPTATETSVPANTPTHTPTPTNTATSVPTATNTAVPTATPTATATSVVQFRDNIWSRVDTFGNLHVVGEIRNIGQTPISFIEITAILRDEQNNVLAIEDTFASTSVLLPGEYACFQVIFFDPPPIAQITNIETFADAVPGGTVVPGLTLSNVNTQYVPGGYQITGNVTNTTLQPRNNIWVYATIYSGPSGTGVVLRCHPVQLSPSNLAAGQIGNFLVQSPALIVGDVGSYFIRAESLDP